jgi:membrane fusion protein, multidrug efflux system
VKKAILLILIGAALGGGAVWIKYYSGADVTASAPAATEEADATRITHDTNGNAVVNMSDETQGDVGIVVAELAAAQYSPEMTGSGRVQDPAPLAALMTELASDRAAYAASSNELARLKIMAEQGNASARALQTAEATALRDQLAMQSARQRLVLSLGKTLADREDLPALLESLASQEAALVRIDLPAGEIPAAPPTGARLAMLSGGAAEAQYLSEAAGVDPQMQGRGYLFLVKPNPAGLLPGQAVTGYLKLPGEPVGGVIIPRNAVVRTEGRGWVYVLQSGGEALTRTPIALDHPTEDGWFVSQGVTAGQHVVVAGAQILLSQEMKGSIKAD